MNRSKYLNGYIKPDRVWVRAGQTWQRSQTAFPFLILRRSDKKNLWVVEQNEIFTIYSEDYITNRCSLINE